MEYAIALALFALGLLVGRFLLPRKYDGTFKIDRTDELRDIYSMNFNVDLDDIPKKKSVLFKIEVTGSH